MALPNDMSRIAGALSKLEGSNSADYTASVPKTARQLIRRTFFLTKGAADSMASTTTAYTAAEQLYMTRACRVLGAWIQPQGTLTAHDTTNATVNVVKGDGAAGAAVVAAAAVTSTTGTDDWVAGTTVPMAVSSTAANTRLARGDVLSFNITKGSTGVVVPACKIAVEVEFEDVDAFAV